MLRKKIITIMMCSILCFMLIGTTTLDAYSKSSSYANVSKGYNEINKYRNLYNKGKSKNKKICMLKRDVNLEKIAKIRAKEISTKFSHTRPNGKRGLKLITGNKAKGENLARGNNITYISATEMLYNSKSHRANMLRKEFTKVGIAAYKRNGITYYVQMFSN